MINIHAILKSVRLLIKFGYIGWLYSGYQTGNGERSVEDTILKTLRKNNLAEMVHSAARTDRNVSAISNAFAIDTEELPSKVLGILNSSIDGMIFHSVAEVDVEYNPRHCDYKVYRYTLQEQEAGPYLKSVLMKFKGKHDFRHFCKMDERNPVRTINAIKVGKKNGVITVDFKARSFLWNQIRTILAYAVDKSFKEVSEDPFERDSRYGRLLDPEPLMLLEMIYKGVEFEPALSLSKIKQFQQVIMESRIKNSILSQFSSLLEERK